MTDLLQRVEQNIQNRRLLQRGQAVLVAVSGGLDSMVLLHALHELSSRQRWQLTVAHFNHQLRGRSSDADEKLVRQTAAAMRLPFVAGRANVKEFSRKTKLSIEMAARKLRHDFFARTANERKIRVIALAHHADDQVELFFLRVLRGAGGEGLAGMKWRVPSPVDSRIRLVRPLLNATKTELRGFAREGKILFREDATNASLDLPRNRVRNELLPLLQRRYQPALRKTVLRLMEIVGAEADVVGEMAKCWLKEKRVGRCCRAARLSSSSAPPAREYARPTGDCNFVDLPIAVQRRVLQLQLAGLGVPMDFDLVEQLRESSGKFVSVSAALSVARDADGKLDCREHLPEKFNADELSVCLNPRIIGGSAGSGRSAPVLGRSKVGGAGALEKSMPPVFPGLLRPGRAHSATKLFNQALKLPGRAGRAEFGGRKFHWQIESQKKVVLPKKQAGLESFDADKVGGRITLRHWRPGDQFQPIGLRSPAKLQDLFTNRKIPRARRRELMVAAAENGEIFWVEGLRISENFKLTPQTRRRLAWRWRHRAGFSKAA